MQPAFGAASTPAFGAASTPAFGAASTPAFGASPFGGGGSAFGTPASTPAFGAASTPAFGASPGAFGGRKDLADLASQKHNIMHMQAPGVSFKKHSTLACSSVIPLTASLLTCEAAQAASESAWMPFERSAQTAAGSLLVLAAHARPLGLQQALNKTSLHAHA